MIKKIFQKLLQKKGKTYTLDSDIPSSLLIRSLWSRFIMLSRGYFWLFKKIYLGANCKITNKKNIHFGNNVTLENNVSIDGYAKSKLVFGNNVKIGSYSYVSCTSHFSKFGASLKIGNNSAFGRFTEFGSAGGIEIGNDVIMGSYISFHSENHNFNDLTRLIREQGVTSKGIKIGNNVWVGAKVTFLDGCIVGNNTVVAAGAVVNGVYPDNSIIGGIPAKVLKPI